MIRSSAASVILVLLAVLSAAPALAAPRPQSPYKDYHSHSGHSHKRQDPPTVPAAPSTPALDILIPKRVSTTLPLFLHSKLDPFPPSRMHQWLRIVSFLEKKPPQTPPMANGPPLPLLTLLPSTTTASLVSWSPRIEHGMRLSRMFLSHCRPARRLNTWVGLFVLYA